MVAIINIREKWIEIIIDYIQDGKLPKDRHLARKLVQKALRYTIIREKLYMCSYSEPHTLCVTSKYDLTNP